MTSQISRRAESDDSSYELSTHADLIASGRTAIPMDWPQERLEKLLNEVHRLRRQRLVQFLGQSIAKDLVTERLE